MLTKCTDCGRDVSTAAIACPACGRLRAMDSQGEGAPLRAKTDRTRVVLGAALGVAFLMLAWANNCARSSDERAMPKISDKKEEMPPTIVKEEEELKARARYYVLKMCTEGKLDSLSETCRGLREPASE